ncbi:MAG: hypothetical protein FD143_2366 [Ignavibacteria bacterium]|nr:MAG: hypothetical protein FD143_2366 [Ignavibacteria bacterium]KAF0155982.1 MAG: hypothetical protein FD188_3051 [Ignavibacteria bacterium]
MKFSKLISALLYSAFLFSCNINEPNMPLWDVSLNLPIAKKNYSLMDLLEKSTELKHYKDGSNLLYLAQEHTIEKIELRDKLKINAVSESASETIGVISIAGDSVSANIGFSWISSGIAPVSQAIVPPVNDVPVSINTDVLGEFLAIKLDGGTIDLSITNQFPQPVSLTLKNIVLKNSASGEIIAHYPSSIIIPAKDARTIKAIAIAKGVFIRNQLTLECFVSTSGSGGNVITLPQNSFSVKAKLLNLSVVEAQAKIPVQDPIVISNTINLDANKAQPNKFTNIKIESGALNIKVINNLDVDATLTFTINNLKNPNGQTFTEIRTIGRRQTVTLFNNFSLSNYSVVSLTSVPTNQISYKITFQTKAANDFRTIKSTDGISGSIDLSNLQLKEFSGQIEPQIVTAERSAISLDLKDLKNKLQFGEINLRKPLVQLRLKTNAQFEFRIDGKIQAQNSIGQKAVLGLNSRTLNTTLISPSDSVLTINPDSLSLFFKKFSSFPDSLIVYTGGTLNPNYKTVTLKNTDQISGRSIFELPLDLGISNAVITDSVSVDLSKDDRDKINDVNSLEAGVVLTNGLPASISFTGKLYDSNNNFLAYFPPKYSDQDSVLTFSGAFTDAAGNVSSKNKQTKTVRALKAEIDKIAKAKYMRITIKLNTTAPGNAPVRFRTTDDLLIHAFGSTNYRINP